MQVYEDNPISFNHPNNLNPKALKNNNPRQKYVNHRRDSKFRTVKANGVGGNQWELSNLEKGMTNSEFMLIKRPSIN